jgi:pimeloyl-ACP methyl ester carboxylesterase
LAGPAVNGIELLQEQNRAIFEGAGVAEDLLAARLEILRRTNTIRAGDGDVEGPATETAKYLASVLANFSANELQRMGIGADGTAMLRQLRAPWTRAFLAYDPAEDLRQIDIPLLALFGTKDTQVVAEQNAPAMRDVLEAAGNTRFEIEVLENPNHLFQTAVTGLPGEYVRSRRRCLKWPWA